MRLHWAIALAVVAAFAGYFAGREHLKYEMRKGITQAVEAFGKGVEAAFGGAEDPVPAEDSVVDAVVAEAAVDAYRPYLKLYDVRAGYERDILDGRVPVVRGKIKNEGNKTLTRVEVTAYFLDSSGKRIYEQDFPAVLVSSLSFSDDDKPLKPGYIQKFGFKATDCPGEWKPGAVECAITGMRFLDEQ